MLVYYSGMGRLAIGDDDEIHYDKVDFYRGVFQLPKEAEIELIYKDSTFVHNLLIVEHIHAPDIDTEVVKELSRSLFDDPTRKFLSLKSDDFPEHGGHIFYKTDIIPDPPDEQYGNSQLMPRPDQNQPYLSNDLKILIQASERFWSNADPNEKDTHATNQTVIDWLKEQGLSGATAKQGAVIIRPQWAAVGRRPKD